MNWHVRITSVISQWPNTCPFFVFMRVLVPCQLEELMNTLERTRQELDSTKQRLSSTQQSLQERDTHLTNMRQERRKQLEEILEMKLVPPWHATAADRFSPPDVPPAEALIPLMEKLCIKKFFCLKSHQHWLQNLKKSPGRHMVHGWKNGVASKQDHSNNQRCSVETDIHFKHISLLNIYIKII